MSKPNFSNKTNAREYAFKFIYHLFLEDFKTEKNKITSDKKVLETAILEFEESYIKEDEEHTENTLNPSIQSNGQKLINGFLLNEKEIFSLIEKNLQKRSLSSIGNIEKSVICLGAFEIVFDETPKKVVINEYLNIVKKYGSKESSSFVNGILDKISK